LFFTPSALAQARALFVCPRPSAGIRFMALIALTDIELAYGHVPLLHQANFSVEAGERVGLIGRNGTGKSSLLKLLDGRIQPDDGLISRQDGLKIATVEQEPIFDESGTVFDAVSE